MTIIKKISPLNCNRLVNIYVNELQQVILNLIKNAEDVLKEKEIIDAEIKISTLYSHGYTIIKIEDNGGGIDESIINKIFDPYFSTKLEKEGTGLGLYMSQTIIHEHCAGTLCAKNGQDGAIFTIKMEDIDV